MFPQRQLGAMPVPSVMEQVMIAIGSTAGEEREPYGERGMAFMLALFLGAVQVGWLGLLLWVTCQIIGAI
jgi:hypothetical protein